MSIISADRPGVPQRSREGIDPAVLWAYVRLPLLAFVAGLAVALALTLAWPERCAAIARVMVQAGLADGNRIVKLEQAARAIRRRRWRRCVPGSAPTCGRRPESSTGRSRCACAPASR